eukprot:CAMPEP_0176487162 /NCGR_PEP_ID=MMETSP0200_2-20121128/5970_1 /TAXON_ID=947934 /ORGANISM="Chaetoceros sp., Strain GSL56" /LENGTH=673 /DNA_ID=CAMNT_0017883943 /DNA_START=404 /DNA_END=2425 /DNA_ORIENTATION=+
MVFLTFGSTNFTREVENQYPISLPCATLGASHTSAARYCNPCQITDNGKMFYRQFTANSASRSIDSSSRLTLPYPEFLVSAAEYRKRMIYSVTNLPPRKHFFTAAFTPRTINHVIPPILLTKLRNNVHTSSSTTKSFGIFNDSMDHVAKGRPTLKMSEAKIAIVGGGICGVTAAHAIKTRLQTIAPNHKVDIVIYEGDSNALGDVYITGKESQTDFKNMIQPIWKSATARNANSLVPGAAMHIFSKRSTLIEIATDTLRETYLSLTSGDANNRDFSSAPPYFGFSPVRCLGWSASWIERQFFVTFLYHFVKTSIFTGEDGAKERCKILVQLAKANRFALNNYIHGCDKEFSKRIGLQEGFISVHRTKEKALHALEEAKEYSEDAELLSTARAIEMEPKLANLPIKDGYFVYRKHDQTADCAEYIRNMIISLSRQDGVSYEVTHGCVKDIQLLKSQNNKDHQRFKIISSHGYEDEFDYVILAAGVQTPVFAANMKVGLACPIYPLRGYSLTIFLKNEGLQPFLKKAMSFDNMYCTSVAPNMVRMAGFGEIAGFPKYNKTSVSRRGPMVLEKYGKYIFEQDSAIDIEGTALPCYRPITPDDIPVVGSVRKIPRLFVHCGHGTLGWTMSLATAQCLAQDVCDEMLGVDDRDAFVLPDGSMIDREILSPNRFSFLPW